MSASRRLYEQRMTQRRAQEASSANLSRYVAAHNEMKANASSEPRIETLRRQKQEVGDETVTVNETTFSKLFSKKTLFKRSPMVIFVYAVFVVGKSPYP